ncbi:hypothetical protein ACFFNY_33415 [Paenibacillus hodogayensis]|uniref:Glycosyltransferase n=1 Tax=Paenibacillus hodogayensis TaxID=279208 RepID=A0ABV5W801_9BACL
MIFGLLSIFGVYGLAILWVHWRRSRPDWNRPKPIRYVLVTRNNGMHIEWYLRLLLFFSKVKARAVHIVVLDERSEDETLVIAARFAALAPDHIEFTEWQDTSIDSMLSRYENEEVVLVRLSNSKELQHIPLFQ